jgi:hypothetical protein
MMGALVVEETRHFRLGPKPLRCRLGLHDWMGWARRCERRFVPTPGTEGMVVCHFYQWRFCPACAAGFDERKTFAVWRLAPDRAVAIGLLTDGERESLREGPLPGVIDIGDRQDAFDTIRDWGAFLASCDSVPSAETAAAAESSLNRFTQCEPLNLRCRFGFHRYAPRSTAQAVFFMLGEEGPNQERCERCRHLGSRYRSFDHHRDLSWIPPDLRPRRFSLTTVRSIVSRGLIRLRPARRASRGAGTSPRGL